MASEAEINRKRLAEELAKPDPDPEIVYALQTTKHLWNMIDTDMVRRGFDKLDDKGYTQSLLARLAPKTNGSLEEKA